MACPTIDDCYISWPLLHSLANGCIDKLASIVRLEESGWTEVGEHLHHKTKCNLLGTLVH